LGWGVAVVFVIGRVGDAFFCSVKLFLGRFLTPVDFGAIEPINSALAILTVPIIAVLALVSKSISRLDAMGNESAKQALIVDMFRLSCAGSFLAGLGIWIFREYILSRLSLSDPSFALIIALLVMLSWWTPFCWAIIRGKQQFGLLSLPQVVAPVATLGLSVLFVGLLQMGLKGALFGQLGGWVLWVLIFLFLLRKDLLGGGNRCLSEYRQLFRGILPMSIFMGSLITLVHYDRLFVRNFLTADSGGYGAIITLGSIPAMLIMPLAFVNFPLASAAHASGRDVQKFLTHSIIVGLAITLLCALFFAFSGDLLLKTWRSEFLSYGRFVWIYALATGLQGVIAAIGHVEIARNKGQFLWGVTIPALSMCTFLYAFRGKMDLEKVLITLLATHVIIFVAVFFFAVRSSKKPVRATPARADNDASQVLCQR
jgi:O-antigen/teichoic acid export membrane protein